MTGRRTLLGSGLLVAGLVGLAALVIALVVLTGDDPVPETEPEPPVAEPEPEPEPDPEPDPVEGETEVAEVVDLSITGTRLVHPGSADHEQVPVDEEALDALVDAIADWLDEHLTDLQDGGEGLVAGAGLAGPQDAGDLAGPEEIIEDASYVFRVGVRGQPEWARVDVEVITDDGEEHAAVLAFTGREEPDLQAVEPRS